VNPSSLGACLNITVNTRVLSHPVTGVERYTLELLQRFGDSVVRIAPQAALGGIRGHAWEQLVLPMRVGNDLLFSPCNTGPLAVANQVLTIHDVAALDHPEWLNAKFALWYRWLTPRLARRVKHIIAVSEFTRSRIIAHTGVAPEKITVIANGVDLRFRPMEPEAIQEALVPLALPSRRYVLSLGSIEPRKNLPRLLEAWGKILPTLPEDVWLVVAGARNTRVFRSMTTDHGSKVYPGAPGSNGGNGGDSPQRHKDTKDDIEKQESRIQNPEAKCQIPNANSSRSVPLPKPSGSCLLDSGFCEPGAQLRVHFTGRVADELLPALYAGAMAFAYLSVYEGFGLPPLEAMAAGTPVITGNLTSIPEVVGEAGMMVDPLDVDAIARGLKELVENQELRSRLGEAGVERAKQFTWDKAAEGTLGVLGRSPSIDQY